MGKLHKIRRAFWKQIDQGIISEEYVRSLYRYGGHVSHYFHGFDYYGSAYRDAPKQRFYFRMFSGWRASYQPYLRKLCREYLGQLVPGERRMRIPETIKAMPKVNKA